jgi:hypothetical protein
MPRQREGEGGGGRAEGEGIPDLAQDDSPGNVSGIEEKEDVCPEESKEQSVVVLSNTLVEPNAVMVEDRNTDTTKGAMFGARDLCYVPSR